ncbi:hypothetical protein BDZ97DRAFT_2058459 [Flammula alnicola]|nr:hypothetical protein BDZ97DRAFT_2058459 [Flammula alnicola]
MWPSWKKTIQERASVDTVLKYSPSPSSPRYTSQSMCLNGPCITSSYTRVPISTGETCHLWRQCAIRVDITGNLKIWIRGNSTKRQFQNMVLPLFPLDNRLIQVTVIDCTLGKNRFGAFGDRTQVLDILKEHRRHIRQLALSCIEIGRFDYEWLTLLAYNIDMPNLEQFILHNPSCHSIARIVRKGPARPYDTHLIPSLIFDEKVKWGNWGPTRLTFLNLTVTDLFDPPSLEDIRAVLKSTSPTLEIFVYEALSTVSRSTSQLRRVKLPMLDRLGVLSCGEHITRLLEIIDAPVLTSLTLRNLVKCPPDRVLLDRPEMGPPAHNPIPGPMDGGALLLNMSRWSSIKVLAIFSIDRLPDLQTAHYIASLKSLERLTLYGRGGPEYFANVLFSSGPHVLPKLSQLLCTAFNINNTINLPTYLKTRMLNGRPMLSELTVNSLYFPMIQQITGNIRHFVQHAAITVHEIEDPIDGKSPPPFPKKEMAVDYTLYPPVPTDDFVQGVYNLIALKRRH